MQSNTVLPVTASLLLAAGCFTLYASQALPAGLNAPLNFEMKDIDGELADLAQYRGQVVLLVNTASKCGLTPQYEALQALYEKYGSKGFTVLAFPANNFKSQEPGTDKEIKAFCTTNYSVTFPLFSKVSVRGEDICPLYEYLTSPTTNPGFDGEISWNFAKFLINRKGLVAARFEPRTVPDDIQIIEALEKALAEK